MNVGKHLEINSHVFRRLVPVLAVWLGAVLPGIALSQNALAGVYTIITIPLSPGNDATGINAAAKSLAITQTRTAMAEVTRCAVGSPLQSITPVPVRRLSLE